MNRELNMEKPQAGNGIKVERTFERFTLGQRWEHMLILISVGALILTGLPQKYRAAALSQQILSTPERLDAVRQVHHIAAVVLLLVGVYHLVHNLYLLLKRDLPGDIFPNREDFRNAWEMIKYLIFLSKEKPAFWKYNFEQKFTYWFLFLTIGVMGITGIITWFPIQVTQFLSGAVVPAAKLAHSTEAIVLTIYILIWHVYHVHIERLNLSIFTGRLSETEMLEHHKLEYQHLMIENEQIPTAEEAEIEAG
jgi:formate dehydrogenase gamma subunit